MDERGAWAYLLVDSRYCIGIWPMAVGTRYLAQVWREGKPVRYLVGTPDRDEAKEAAERAWREDQGNG